MLKQITIFMLMGMMLTTYVDIKKTIVCEEKAGCLCEKDQIQKEGSIKNNPVICSFGQKCNLNKIIGAVCSDVETNDPIQYFKCDNKDFCFCNLAKAPCREGEYCISGTFGSYCSLKDPSTFKDASSFIVKNKQNTKEKYCSEIGGCICKLDPRTQNSLVRKWTVAFNEICSENYLPINVRHVKTEFSQMENIIHKREALGDLYKNKEDKEIFGIAITDASILKAIGDNEIAILVKAEKNKKEWICTEDFCKCNGFEDCPRGTYCLVELKYPVCASFSIATLKPRQSKSSVVGSIIAGDTCNSEKGCLCNSASEISSNTICSKHQKCVLKTSGGKNLLSCENQKSRAEFQCVSGNCFCGGVSRLCNKDEFCRSSVRNFCTPNPIPQIEVDETCEDDVGCTCQLNKSNWLIEDPLRVVCGKGSVCQKKGDSLECVVKQKVNFECTSDLYCPCGTEMCTRNKYCSYDGSTQDCSFWPHLNALGKMLNVFIKKDLFREKVKEFIDNVNKPEISPSQFYQKKSIDDEQEKTETLTVNLFENIDQPEQQGDSKRVDTPNQMSRSKSLTSKTKTEFNIENSNDNFVLQIPKMQKKDEQSLITKPIVNTVLKSIPNNEQQIANHESGIKQLSQSLISQGKTKEITGIGFASKSLTFNSGDKNSQKTNKSTNDISVEKTLPVKEDFKAVLGPILNKKISTPLRTEKLEERKPFIKQENLSKSLNFEIVDPTNLDKFKSFKSRILQSLKEKSQVRPDVLRVNAIKEFKRSLENKIDDDQFTNKIAAIDNGRLALV